MARYSAQAKPLAIGNSPQAEQALAVLRTAFMGTASPGRDLAVEQHIRNGADVVSGLMLDRQSSTLFQQSIDAWLASGGLTPFQPPLALPPRQQAQLGRRMDALVSQRRVTIPFTNAPQSPVAPNLDLKPLAREPSRDRIHAQARTDLSQWFAGLGDRQLAKADANVPPQGVRAACKRGLELAPEHGGPGLTEGAKARARSMASGEGVTDDQLSRMSSFFARHGGYQKQTDPPSPGYVSWLLWGGDAGKTWADSQAQSSEKSGEPKWKKKGWVGPGGAAATAERKAKGKGKGPAYRAAIYRNMTQKSGGAGSRGGHVIGRTKSGKAIYEHKHANYSKLDNYDHQDDTAAKVRESHPDFTREDHLDASNAHSGEGLGAAHAASAHALAYMHMRREETAKRRAMSAAAAHSPASMHTPRTEKSSTPYKRSSAMYSSSKNVLNKYLAKAGGEGSRGGRVLGHTKSGRPIYSHDTGHQDVFNHQKDWTAQDHKDAAEVHEKHAFGPQGYNRSHRNNARRHGFMAEHIESAKEEKAKRSLPYHQSEAKRWGQQLPDVRNAEGKRYTQSMENFHKLKAHYIQREQ